MARIHIAVLALATGCKLLPSDGANFVGETAGEDESAGSGDESGDATEGSDATSTVADASGGGSDGETSGGSCSGATPAQCGNGVAEGDEECDQSDFGFRTCQTYGFLAGTLTCKDDCSVDPSSCSSEAICGDLAIAGLEQCEGEDLGGATCDGLGLGSGELGCTEQCTFDAVGCSCAGKGEGCTWNPGIPGQRTGCCPAGYKGNEHGACTMYYVCI